LADILYIIYGIGKTYEIQIRIQVLRRAEKKNYGDIW